jgi:glutamyl-Q tRNA(Asp) synthetase
LGSLYTAVASYLDARANGGRWIVRIEDLDRPREVPGAADRICATLAAFGFEWDGPVVRQTEREALYTEALSQLDREQLLFACSCSRRQLADEDHYPGTCRAGPTQPGPTCTRLRVDAGHIDFSDLVQGRFRQDVGAAVGDFVLKRRDGVIAYALAVVVDDAAQGITHVVRGADLLDATPRQIYLQRALGLPTPFHAHVPLIIEQDGNKLSKARRSVRLDASLAVPALLEVCRLLGLKPPPTMNTGKLIEVWRWAILNWDLQKVPKVLVSSVPQSLQSPDWRVST